MTESKLQSLMVVEFSQKRPNEKGLLWSTRNTTLSVRDGQKQKAMGMVAGVSDLIHYKVSILNCMEVKLPGAKHNKEHIQSQYDWGKKIEVQGGKYYIITSLHGFWSVINGFDIEKDVYTLQQIKELLDEGKSKIVF